jgi:tRNA (adenine-N(1)-)-methyltransferase non-catalytic subunit
VSLSTKRKNGLLGTSHTTENNTNEFSNDNRHLVDDNTSQAITQGQVEQMRADPAMHGSKIVAKIIQNSSTFKLKTSYSQAKYVRRKQIKYQPRCRLVRCTPSSMCQALYLKDSRKLMNLREDSLAQILSYSNLCAGKRVIVFDTCLGVVLGSCAQRMGGYGTIFGLYTGFAPPYVDWISKFNLSFVEQNSIHWVHTGQLFHDEEGDEGDKEQAEKNILDDKDQEVDMELQEREQLLWPCPLQTHTEQYISKMKTDQERYQFLLKRNSRFARKMTRSTSQEILRNIMDPKRKCQSLIIACKYDPTSTLLSLIQYLEPSCPFVVFYEYLEPLAHCFQIIQEKGLAINLRLCDTWMREYQVLPGRTHPNMTMSQNGGFILTGIKLCPQFGKNELDEHVLKDLRSQYYGRRKGNQKRKLEGGDNEKTKKDMKIN